MNIGDARKERGKRMDFQEPYHRHYITTDSQARILGGWSDGPSLERDAADAICINNEGDYQFRLVVLEDAAQQSPEGEAAPHPVKGLTQENPALYTMEGVPKYRWDAAQEVAVERTQSEIEADIAALPQPAPTPIERLQAENTLLRAQVSAASERQDFLEDCIAEMAAQVYGG